VGHAIRDASKNVEGRKRKVGKSDTSVDSDDMLSQKGKPDVSERTSSPNMDLYAKRLRPSSSFIDRIGTRHESVAPLREDSKFSSMNDMTRMNLMNFSFGNSTFGEQSYSRNLNSELFLPRRNETSLPRQTVVDVARNQLPATASDMSTNRASRAIDDIESHENLLSLISSIFGSGSLTSASTEPASIHDNDIETRITTSSEMIATPAAYHINLTHDQQNVHNDIVSDQHYVHNDIESESDPLLTMINMTLGPPSSDDSGELLKITTQPLDPIQEPHSSEGESTPTFE
jgi:hypothetical protein